MPEAIPTDANEIAAILAPSTTPPPSEASAESQPSTSQVPGQPEPDQTLPLPGSIHYNYPEPIWKEHKTLLDSGTDPHDIPHIRPRGRQKGCQCFECKEARGEVFIVQSASDIGPIADTLLSDLISPKFIGKILDIPNRSMELFCRLRKLPPDVLRLWQTELEEMEAYQKHGKMLADHYLHLPDFKHRDLIVFSTWYAANFGMKVSLMMMIVKAQDGTK